MCCKYNAQGSREIVQPEKLIAKSQESLRKKTVVLQYKVYSYRILHNPFMTASRNIYEDFKYLKNK